MEAPVAGSVILAGVLLKLGGVWIYKIFLTATSRGFRVFWSLYSNFKFTSYYLWKFNNFRQVDLKRIVAYSSVAHMGLVTLSLFSHTVQGLVAAVFFMLAHGLVSSALFIAVTFLYERHHTRLVRYYRGMVITMPLFGTLMLTLVLANASIPLSCNFVGEFFHYWGFSSIVMLWV